MPYSAVVNGCTSCSQAQHRPAGGAAPDSAGSAMQCTSDDGFNSSGGARGQSTAQTVGGPGHRGGGEEGEDGDMMQLTPV